MLITQCIKSIFAAQLANPRKYRISVYPTCMLVLCNGHDLTYLWELQCSLTPFITSIVMLLVSLQLTTVLGSATAANLHGSYTTIQDLCFQNSSLLLLINCTVFMLNCIVPCFFMHTYVRFIVLGRSGLRRIQAACG